MVDALPDIPLMAEFPQYGRDRRVWDRLELQQQLLAGDYVPFWQVVPDTANIVFAARGNFRSTMQIPSGSYLTAVRAVSADERSNLTQFVISIFDDSSERLASNAPIQGCLFASHPLTVVAKNSFTPHISWSFITSPWIVGDKGQITVELTSLASVSSVIQVCLVFAVPRKGAA
jgi:hypothetical protein